jgi:hypothetical protein
MLRIDCDTCVARDTEACDTCLVTFLVERPTGAIVFDADEERALRILHAGGIAPPVRFHDPNAERSA